MWTPFARLRKPRRHPSLWQLMKLYEINHIGKTFGITLEEFVRDPWQYLGKPSPEIQRLWDRPHQLMPKQLEISFNGARHPGGVSPHGVAGDGTREAPKPTRAVRRG